MIKKTNTEGQVAGSGKFQVKIYQSVGSKRRGHVQLSVCSQH